MMRATGWLRPETKHFARMRMAGLSASSYLQGVPDAGSADASSLVQIVDQGQLGSCTANAIGQIIRAEQLRRGAPAGYPFPSRLWIYGLALAADGNFGKDVGTHLCTSIDNAAQHGFPPETTWPYDVSVFGDKPPLEAYHAAIDQVAVESVAYHQITESGQQRLDVIQQSLTAGHLVAFGTQVTEEFCSTSPAPGTVIQKPTGASAGGHAMCWCGFEIDPATGRVRLRTVNSWGPGWGDKGFFWMDCDYATWDETDDLWLVSQAPMYSEVSP